MQRPEAQMMVQMTQYMALLAETGTTVMTEQMAMTERGAKMKQTQKMAMTDESEKRGKSADGAGGRDGDDGDAFVVVIQLPHTLTSFPCVTG